MIRTDVRATIQTLGLLVTGVMLSACSIAMALNGRQEPNFEAFAVGSTRPQVEIQLGPPHTSHPLDGGRTEDTYRYEMGNSPNGARATLYFYYDLMTLGLAEPVFTIVELLQGHREESRITYDADDRVLSIDGYVPPPPSPALQAAKDAQADHARRSTAVSR